jgi:hypothetical protein
MTAHTQRSPKTFGIAIFILLVVLGGSVLAATGNFDNPFRIFMQATSERGPQFTREAGAERPAAGEGFRGESPGQGAISWSNIGGVLFNVWFLFAVATFIIVIQYPLRLIVRLIRSRGQPTPAA